MALDAGGYAGLEFQLGLTEGVGIVTTIEEHMAAVKLVEDHMAALERLKTLEPLHKRREVVLLAVLAVLLLVFACVALAPVWALKDVTCPNCGYRYPRVSESQETRDQAEIEQERRIQQRDRETALIGLQRIMSKLEHGDELSWIDEYMIKQSVLTDSDIRQVAGLMPGRVEQLREVVRQINERPPEQDGEREEKGHPAERQADEGLNVGPQIPRELVLRALSRIERSAEYGEANFWCNIDTLVLATNAAAITDDDIQRTAEHQPHRVERLRRFIERIKMEYDEGREFSSIGD